MRACVFVHVYVCVHVCGGGGMGKEQSEPVEGRLRGISHAAVRAVSCSSSPSSPSSGWTCCCLYCCCSFSFQAACLWHIRRPSSRRRRRHRQVGAVKRESASSGAAGQSCAPAPARSSTPRLVSGGSGSSVNCSESRKAHSGRQWGRRLRFYQDTPRVSVGMHECCLLRDVAVRRTSAAISSRPYRSPSN